MSFSPLFDVLSRHLARLLPRRYRGDRPRRPKWNSPELLWADDIICVRLSRVETHRLFAGLSMKLESVNERAASKPSARRVSGRCLCGAVELEIDFPAFWAWHDHSAASRRAHGAAYATYIGCWRTPVWSRAKEASLASRMRTQSRREASAPDAGRRYFTSASARRPR